MARLEPSVDPDDLPELVVEVGLLADPALDALVTGDSAFEELPQVMPKLASGEIPALCHRIGYGQERLT